MTREQFEALSPLEQALHRMRVNGAQIKDGVAHLSGGIRVRLVMPYEELATRSRNPNRPPLVTFTFGDDRQSPHFQATPRQFMRAKQLCGLTTTRSGGLEKAQDPLPPDVLDPTADDFFGESPLA